MKYKAVIFDMDGTVLNTLDDLIVSLNYALEQTGHAHEYGHREVGTFFGSGIRVAAARALAIEYGASWESMEFVGTKDEVLPSQVTKEMIDAVQAVFVPYYVDHCNIKTGPYEGIMELLLKLREEGVLTAVVSNKSDPAVQELVVKCFDGLFDRSMGEQEGVIRRKPAPDMTLKVMEELGVEAKECVYIGDSEIDLQTAENTGCDCIAVTWGFRTEEFLAAHGAKTIVHTSEELYKELRG